MKNIPSVKETILKQSFAPGFAPDKEVDEKLKAQIEEKMIMMKRKHAVRVTLIAAVLTLAFSATCLAAYHLLSPGDAAREMRLPKLERAFQAEYAVSINETKTDGRFNYTLLGITYGQNLFGFPIDDSQVESLNYAVFAIEYTDGSKFIPIPQINGRSIEEFLNSFTEEEKQQQELIGDFRAMPVVNGMDLSAFSDIGWATDVVNGVLYLAVEYNQLEKLSADGVTMLLNHGWIEYSDLSMENGTLQVKDTYPGVVFNLSELMAAAQ